MVAMVMPPPLPPGLGCGEEYTASLARDIPTTRVGPCGPWQEKRQEGAPTRGVEEMWPDWRLGSCREYRSKESLDVRKSSLPTTSTHENCWPLYGVGQRLICQLCEGNKVTWSSLSPWMATSSFSLGEYEVASTGAEM